MSSQPDRSKDLLNIPGKKKTIAKLLSENSEEVNTRTAPKRPKTFKVSPPTELLSRVQAFLPQLHAANERLKEKDPSELDIENVEDNEQYIEMNLGLGVFEQKDGNDSSESDNENDEDENDIIIPASSSKPSIENPTIEELPSHSTEEDKAISDKEEKSSSSSSSSEEEV